jgi:TRAP-type C4-dicarboxylate transport system substrate-binding protein
VQSGGAGCQIAISTSQNSHRGVGIDVFAKEAEKLTAGHYKVETFSSGTLGGTRDAIDAVQFGTQALSPSLTGPVPNSGGQALPPVAIFFIASGAISTWSGGIFSSEYRRFSSWLPA